MKFQLTEKGLVMILTLACATTLIATGHNAIIAWVMFAAVVGYFGIEVYPWPQIKRRRKGE